MSDLIRRQDATNAIYHHFPHLTMDECRAILHEVSNVHVLSKDADSISRQAAIDAIEFGITYMKAINIETGEITEPFAKINGELREAVNRVKELPSAQLEGRSGVFIPDITVKNLRKAPLEAVGELLVLGEMEDIVLPSAQTEIIRCKDCAHWDRETVRQNSNDVGCWNEAICEKYSDEIWTTWKDADWYCADAERRTDE